MMRLSNNTFWYWCAVAVLLGVTVFYSCYKLAESPPTWYDEGIYIQVAQSMAHTGMQSVQVAPGTDVSTGFVTGGYPFLAPVALSLKLFGNSLFAARLPMVFFILLCAASAFLLIYKLSGKQDALLALALLATFPLLYGNGKNVLGEVPGMLYLFLALYFLLQIEKHEFKGTKWYLLAGLFVGLASATKPIFFLLPAAVGLVFLFNIRRIPLHWKEISIAALACIVPLLLWAYLQFGGGDNAVSILSHYANPYAEVSLAHTMLQNFLRFFKEATPLYCAALTGLWALAVGVRVYKKEKIFFAEWVAFVFSALILVAYLRTEGWYRYFFEAMMLALIFAPHSLRAVTPKKYISYAAALLCVLVLIQFYQLNTSSWVAEHYADTTDATLASYFTSTPQKGSVLVYNAPEIVPFLPSNNYYQYFDIDPAGTLSYGADNAPLLATGVFNEVITTPDEYAQYASLFEGYTKQASVAGYLVLAKK